jgi:hypothetical protein
MVSDDAMFGRRRCRNGSAQYHCGGECDFYFGGVIPAQLGPGEHRSISRLTRRAGRAVISITGKTATFTGYSRRTLIAAVFLDHIFTSGDGSGLK